MGNNYFSYVRNYIPVTYQKKTGPIEGDNSFRLWRENIKVVKKIG